MNSQAVHRLIQAGDWPVYAKSASATISPNEMNSTITTRGATGAVTFTLPSPVGLKGKKVTFYNVVDQNMVISCTGKLAGLDGVAFDTATFSTADELIGACADVVSDGTNWLVKPIQGTVAFA